MSGVPYPIEDNGILGAVSAPRQSVVVPPAAMSSAAMEIVVVALALLVMVPGGSSTISFPVNMMEEKCLRLVSLLQQDS